MVLKEINERVKERVRTEALTSYERGEGSDYFIER